MRGISSPDLKLAGTPLFQKKMELEAVLGYPDMSASYPKEKFLENTPDTEKVWCTNHSCP